MLTNIYSIAGTVIDFKFYYPFTYLSVRSKITKFRPCYPHSYFCGAASIF